MCREKFTKIYYETFGELGWSSDFWSSIWNIPENEEWYKNI